MQAPLLLLVCGTLLLAESPPSVPLPFYTPSSIVNAASFKAGPLSPNAIGTLYGRDLAFTTRAVTNADLYNDTLPTTLLGTGVRLMIDGTLTFLYYVSPTQINFLVPSTLRPGVRHVQLVLDGRAAESVPIQLAEASPALFALDPETALATNLDGSVVASAKPARPGHIIILYATGLGATRPRLPAGQMPVGIAWLDRLSEFQVTLNGIAVERTDILYAGSAPGFAGLYQINLRLPANLPKNPEVQIGFADTMSPAQVRLPAEPRNP